MHCNSQGWILRFIFHIILWGPHSQTLNLFYRPCIIDHHHRLCLQWTSMVLLSIDCSFGRDFGVLIQIFVLTILLWDWIWQTVWLLVFYVRTASNAWISFVPYRSKFFQSVSQQTTNTSKYENSKCTLHRDLSPGNRNGQ